MVIGADEYCHSDTTSSPPPGLKGTDSSADPPLAQRAQFNLDATWRLSYNYTQTFNSSKLDQRNAQHAATPITKRHPMTPRTPLTLEYTNNHNQKRQETGPRHDRGQHKIIPQLSPHNPCPLTSRPRGTSHTHKLVSHDWETEQLSDIADTAHPPPPTAPQYSG
ncbi:Hypothetical predicted protein [Pelobates cultripes]|uniref:Uncharacterized protein n=1 Tax=Pelobates cultripes TaxID=61616 RepID=A0AAD1W751_PELCU|nr:Hypothetical predicted protein [Pelobates cultripes]